MKNVIKIYLQPAFLICVALLAIAGGGMSFAQKKFEIWLRKEPWPLRKSLDLLDEGGLAPYKVVSKQEIEYEDVIESLGTENYIQWVLEDTEVPKDSSVRLMNLFITYYDLPDVVVHVPEECYTGGGYQRIGIQDVTFLVTSRADSEVNDGSIDEKLLSPKKLSGKYLLFYNPKANPWDGRSRFPVLYLICVNDEYVSNRKDARFILGKNVFGKHSYYSKIEMAFNVNNVVPDKDAAVQACQKLLSVILPVLESEHWPRFKDEKKLKAEQ